MAPVQKELQVEIHNGSDVIELVNREATWRDLLIDLVGRNKLDPWNIDIMEIVDSYVDTVKRLKVLDFRVPANIILAAAILLRMKSNLMSMPEYEEPIPEDGMIAEEVGRPEISVDPLNFRLRLAPRRKISLNELLSALDEAISIKDKRTLVPQKLQPALPISLENFDIEAETERLYEEINRNVDKSGMITFNHLSSISSNEDVLLGLFIPLLFLAHNGRVSLVQEKFFSEIIIALK